MSKSAIIIIIIHIKFSNFPADVVILNMLYLGLYIFNAKTMAVLYNHM